LPVLAVLALAAGLWFGLQQMIPRTPETPSVQSATVLSNPRPLQPFSLIGQDGIPFTLDNLKGHWSFLAIGYTHCPDVCPTTLATYNAIQERIGDADKATRFVFVSVDPERDSPETLARYLAYFNPDFEGATGTHSDLQGFVSQLGLLYGKHTGQETAMGYLVDHSASILLTDPEARLTAIFSSPHDPRAMAQDLTTIMAASTP
jgi:protein SCO1/2